MTPPRNSPIPTPPAVREEPSSQLDDPHRLLAEYLDFYRETILAKLDGLTESQLRASRVPSGWTPLELLWHLAHVERRWLRWGFEGEDVSAPWGDHGTGKGWSVPQGVTAEEVVARYRNQCERSREIIAKASLADRAQTGGAYSDTSETPTLAWILFHLLQEYARHAGQLDIVRELIDGRAGK
ncbi:DinB family protein [Streptomyces aidingensis]|uniref:Uncharacterized damage-inducible protein DinB (Forms a four-helix bundle) n=1 Tax=Streptomyces aidingensis TaxID=910347 RepID=A0A1I1J168_9ACTN|nr:DinB family protein [Streptomyces aidingensis]SFC42145.1 Uncharacterized damage-inducible protein DinB (forms a four-helix bundle) [Streptomyces aidingensis]